MRKKSLIIGLDGAPYHLFSKWFTEKKLLFTGKLIEEGVFGILETTIPPYTMIAWPCFYTGKNPAKIGPFLIKSEGFDPEAFSRSHFLSANEIKTWTIWEYLSELNYKVGVMNVPVTYPPKKVNG
ncbi:MAG: alkaline phosphatase family protein, partial [candidate division WOR-3 bacterium]